MNPDLTAPKGAREQSDPGPYCLQRRSMTKQTTFVMNGWNLGLDKQNF